MKHNRSQDNDNSEFSSGRVVGIGIYSAILFLVLYVVYLNFKNVDVNSAPPTVAPIQTVTPGNQFTPVVTSTTHVIRPSETSTIIPSATLPSTVVLIDSNTFESYNAQVSCRQIDKANLRKSPGYVDKDDSKDVIVEVPCKQVVQLLGVTRYVDELTWWKIKWRSYEGWISDYTGSGKEILVFSRPKTFLKTNPTEFVFWYLNTIWQERNYEHLWDTFLTPDFQNHSSSGDFNEYKRWWDSVLRIDVNSIDVLDNSGSEATISINVTFYLTDGRKLDNRKYSYTLAYDSSKNIWMFDY